MNAGIFGLSGILTGYGISQARRDPEIVRIEVPLPRLPAAFNGFRIVQFTDMHTGLTIGADFMRDVVERVNRLEPDLIAFTGDLADGRVPALRGDVAPLKDLAAPYGLYFITGNHEYYSGVEPWLDEVDRLGFDILINEHRLIRIGEDRIVLAGVTDYYGGQFLPDHASDPAKALAGAPVNTARILLAHQPRSIYAASKAGADLQISGHTHGGQYYPWNILVILQQPYIRGFHRHENTRLYVSSGTGYWGPPLRIGTRPEITEIVLKK